MKRNNDPGHFDRTSDSAPQGVESIRGSLDGAGRTFVLVVSRFHGDITDSLARGAIDTLVKHGVDPSDVRLVSVPGAWELPAAVAWVADALDPDGIVAAGCVIRGETPHFDYVAGEAARGLAEVGLETAVPIAFAVLTTDTVEQALARAGEGQENKGREAALTVLEMANLFDALDDR